MSTLAHFSCTCTFSVFSFLPATTTNPPRQHTHVLLFPSHNPLLLILQEVRMRLKTGRVISDNSPVILPFLEPHQPVGRRSSRRVNLVLLSTCSYPSLHASHVTKVSDLTYNLVPVPTSCQCHLCFCFGCGSGISICEIGCQSLLSVYTRCIFGVEHNEVVKHCLIFMVASLI